MTRAACAAWIALAIAAARAPGKAAAASKTPSKAAAAKTTAPGKTTPSGKAAAPGKGASGHGGPRRASAAEPPPPRAWARPAPPIPMLPSVARVRVEAARDHVVVVEDVSLPRGDWRSGGLSLYVAFGAPGTPLAVDAHLLPVPEGALEPRPDDPGEVLPLEPAFRRTAAAQPLLGSSEMAGMVVRVKEAQLRRGYAEAGLVVLRVRSLLPAPGTDASGACDVVVRLGAVDGVPLTLGRVQVVSREARPWITRAEASLCGPDAVAWPLTVSLLPPPKDAARAAEAIAPPMAVRHASDDLCVRWWASN